MIASLAPPNYTSDLLPVVASVVFPRSGLKIANLSPVLRTRSNTAVATYTRPAGLFSFPLSSTTDPMVPQTPWPEHSRRFARKKEDRCCHQRDKQRPGNQRPPRGCWAQRRQDPSL